MNAQSRVVWYSGTTWALHPVIGVSALKAWSTGASGLYGALLGAYCSREWDKSLASVILFNGHNSHTVAEVIVIWQEGDN